MPAWPRRSSYPAVGALFALGAPLGFLVVRAIAQPAWPTPAWIAGELDGLALEYAYLTVSTTVVMAIFGRILGLRDDRLEESASIDPLTGLWNRRQIVARLREEVARARRQHTPLAVLMIDVDGLKPINDLHGHEAGDDALRSVAAAIQDSSRAVDLAARWGGDEFVVLATGTTAVAAGELAERIGLAARGRGLTVSIGVAELCDRLTVDGDAVIRDADHALYLAKQRGRDRFVIAEPQRPNG
jgi:diguanylate cyclase (GGDEF)-like protein